eukprot:TRINITY_DN3924_c0_g1_i1.p1 TRINITY_DN3924_c0_g1~~TRINITY_DN3924_c0_g1_i1.p1  ORF type:complete len:155 (+),score=19.79 TRINITY_DN3924_c0_g1_i1:737-1201(+)
MAIGKPICSIPLCHLGRTPWIYIQKVFEMSLPVSLKIVLLRLPYRFLRGILASAHGKVPLSSAHGAEGPCALHVYPLEDAVKVKSMVASSPNYWTVISWHFALWAATIEGIPADTACVVICIPCPCGNCMPVKNLGFHDWSLTTDSVSVDGSLR